MANEKLIDVLINTVNRIESKVDTIIGTMVTKDDCKLYRDSCPLKDRAKTRIETIKESKLLIAGIAGGIVAVIKALVDIKTAI